MIVKLLNSANTQINQQNSQQNSSISKQQLVWSSNQTSNSNASTWFDLQIENLDLNLSLSQAQTFDTLEDLSLSQVSNQNVKTWFEFESNFKFRCRIWFDSSKILISWRITLFRDIFDTNYRCFFSEFSNFFFALFHIDQTW